MNQSLKPKDGTKHLFYGSALVCYLRGIENRIEETRAYRIIAF